MKNLIFIFFLFSSTAGLAQEQSVDPDVDCAAVLAAPPFVDMLIRNDGNDFGELSPLKSGRALIGLECNADELTDFFENAGWEFLGYEERSLAGPFGGSRGISEYFVDASASYCLKRPTIFGMFGFRCRPMATFAFNKGQISHLIVHMSK